MSLTDSKSRAVFPIRRRPVITVTVSYTHLRKEVKEYAKMTAINDLHIGASYNVFKGVSVYAQVHNLLNKKYQYYLDVYKRQFLSYLSLQKEKQHNERLIPSSIKTPVPI